MPRTLTAQIERAVRDFVTGPSSAISGHLAVFSGTTGKIVSDGGAPGGGGGGSLPESTGANKVLFDDGVTQAWSDGPTLESLTIPNTDADYEIIHDIYGLTHKKISTGATRHIFATEIGGSAKLHGSGDSQAYLTWTNDATKPCAVFGLGHDSAWDAEHDGVILVGRSLNDTADNQTWFGDTVHPVFLVGTPNITVIASGENDTSFRLKNKTNPELGCLYWNNNNFVVGTQGGVDGGTARDTIVDAAASLILATEGTSRWTLVADDGHLRPWDNHVYDLGTPDYKVRTVYLNALVSESDTLNLGLSGEPTTAVQTIQPAASGSGAGGGLIITAGGGATSGGGLTLTGGFGGGDVGGAVQIAGGAGTGASAGGGVSIVGGNSDSGPRGTVALGGAAVLVATEYLNFGETTGESGYGLRDNSGTIEAKNSGGEWAALGGVTVPGEDTQVLFNDGGAIGASDRLVFDKINALLRVQARSSVDLVLTPTPGGGATRYDYFVIATFDSGRTTASDNVVSTTEGPAALDTDNYITLTWAAIPGAVSYSVYATQRDGTPSSIGLLGTTTDPTFVDNGVAGDDAVPTFPAPTNGTGNIAATGDLIAGRDLLLTGRLIAGGDTLTLGLPGAPTATQTIQPAASLANGDGAAQITVKGATVQSTDNGGSAVLAGTDAGDGYGVGAVITAEGRSYISAGVGNGGSADIIAGNGYGAGAAGGNVQIVAGSGLSDAAPGIISLAGATIADSPITAPDFIVSGSRFKTDTTDGHAASLSCYDVDGAAYVDFITLTNGNTPTCVVQATDFKASDGTSGYTGTLTLAGLLTIGVKNGLIVSST